MTSTILRACTGITDFICAIRSFGTFITVGTTRGMIPGTGGMVRIIASDITVGTIGAGVGTIIPDGISGGTTDGTAGITAIGLAEVSSTAAIVALRQVVAM
jgi:hypothetical protein